MLGFLFFEQLELLRHMSFDSKRGFFLLLARVKLNMFNSTRASDFLLRIGRWSHGEILSREPLVRELASCDHGLIRNCTKSAVIMKFKVVAIER